MAYGPKSKKRHARRMRVASRLAQAADYKGAADAASHARMMGRSERRNHVLADVYAACQFAGYPVGRP
jgi:hypothetical protein